MKATPFFLGAAAAALLAGGAVVAQDPEAAAPPSEAQVAPAADVAELPVTTASATARAEFLTGRALVEDLRNTEAVTHLERAVATDPGFALAKAYLARLTPGPKGATLMYQALGAAAALPASERLVVEVFAAEQRGDLKEAHALAAHLAGLAPRAWRAHWLVGETAMRQRDLPTAKVAFEAAARLAPKVGSLQNLLGYVDLTQGDKAGALAAFRRYAELAPGEPNPQDSLGEALLASGDLEQAEQAFRQAVALDPGFHLAWTGIAQTQALRGNFSGARETLARARTAATRNADRMEIDDFLAWVYAAEGKYVAATHLLGQVEITARREGLAMHELVAGLDRAAIESAMGAPTKAVTTVRATLRAGNVLHLPKGERMRLRAFGYAVMAHAQANLRHAGDASHTIAEIDALTDQAPHDPQIASWSNFVRGEARFAGSEYQGAAAYFARCLPEFSFCHARQVIALRKAGNGKAAQAAQKTLLETPRRTTEYLFARATLDTLPRTQARAE